MTKNEKVQLFCYIATFRLFATFINNKNQGVNFKWSTFLQIAGNHCRSHLCLTYPEFPYGCKYEQKAYELGKQIAETLVKEAGLAQN